eukprot:5693321-Amphidinium_carterae.1
MRAESYYYRHEMKLKISETISNGFDHSNHVHYESNSDSTKQCEYKSVHLIYVILNCQRSEVSFTYLGEVRKEHSDSLRPWRLFSKQ